MTMLDVLAVVPARGGSRRIVGKNIRPFAGKPLLTWTIECAKQSTMVTRIVVTTDSKEIAGVARASGGEVPFMRSRKLSGGEVPTLPVILDTLTKLEPYRPDLVVLLQPTSPLRTPEDIDGAVLALIEDPSADSAVSCQRVPHQFLPEKLMRSSTPVVVESPSSSKIDQNETLLARNGPSVLVTRIGVLDLGSLYGERSVLFEMPAERSVDIDTELDFRIAEFLCKASLQS